MRTCSYADSRNTERCTECGMSVDLCQCQNVDDKASARLASPEGEFLTAVWRQTAQGNPRYNLLEHSLEQFGKVAILLTKADSPDSEIYRSLVQLCVLLTALAAQGAPEYTYSGS